MSQKTPWVIILSGIVAWVLSLQTQAAPPAVRTPSTPPATTAKPQSIGELMSIIQTMQSRIAELEAKVQSLEERLAAKEDEGDDKPSATASSMSMVISEIEPQPADLETLDKIADLESQAEAELAAAAKAQKEADDYISKHTGSSNDPWGIKDQDRTDDAKRQAAIKRKDEHVRNARALTGEAKKLQRQHDERGPIIRGTSGGTSGSTAGRHITLELAKALPRPLQDLHTGETITWKGKIRQSDSIQEVWTVTTVERAP